jgi:2-amino-4-hydroxy-6-hydroxymethyldihydropteridine diphosphokinase
VVLVAIALGGNLGDRAAHMASGVAALRLIIPDLVISSFIETEPVDVGPQPRFLNGAATGHWDGEAPALLTHLLGIERLAGRERPRLGAPRTLDLDLILFGDAIIDSPDLTVPHPRFRDRVFVLKPLSQIASDMCDPVTGVTVGELWRRLKETQQCA